MRVRRSFLLLGWALATVAGCRSPEDGRPRGDGPGGDGGNYSGKPIHAPSKLDGTKSWPPRATES